MSVDGKVAIEGHVKTGLRFPLYPFELSRYLPTINDINIFNSRIFLGNPSIDPRSLSVGDRYIAFSDTISLADKVKENEGGHNHLIRGMSTIEPLIYISSALGNHFPGNGAIYLFQEGTFSPEIPFVVLLRSGLLVDIMVIGKERAVNRKSGESGMVYTLATNVFNVYNKVRYSPVVHAYKIFEGTAGVMVRTEAKPAFLN